MQGPICLAGSDYYSPSPKYGANATTKLSKGRFHGSNTGTNDPSASMLYPKTDPKTPRELPKVTSNSSKRSASGSSTPAGATFPAKSAPS